MFTTPNLHRYLGGPPKFPLASRIIRLYPSSPATGPASFSAHGCTWACAHITALSRPLNGLVHWPCVTTCAGRHSFLALWYTAGLVSINTLFHHYLLFPLSSYHIYLFMIDPFFLSSIFISSNDLSIIFCPNKTPRYTQEANTTALAIEPSHPSGLLNLFHPASLPTTTHYPQESAAFYPPAAQVFPSLDVRSRLNNK